MSLPIDFQNLDDNKSLNDNQSLDVKKSENATSVPKNNLARLMYYLDCVYAVIDVDFSMKLTDYSSYDRLSKEEEDLVLSLATKFTPYIMLENYVFFVDSKYDLNSSSNDFYNLTDNNIKIRPYSQVMIGEVSRKVFKVMVCSKNWLEDYYYEPMKKYSSGYRYNKSCCSDCHCCNLNCLERCCANCCNCDDCYDCDDCCDCNDCCENCCERFCDYICEENGCLDESFDGCFNCNGCCNDYCNPCCKKCCCLLFILFIICWVGTIIFHISNT